MNLDEQIVLHLLYEENKEPIRGKTRFQKLVFLIDRSMKKKGKETSFQYVPFKYGPYSSNLNNMLFFMENNGLIKKVKKVHDDFETFEYSISDKGINALEGIDKKILEIIRKIKEYCNKKELNELIMAVYRQYPEFAIKSDLISHED